MVRWWLYQLHHQVCMISFPDSLTQELSISLCFLLRKYHSQTSHDLHQHWSHSVEANDGVMSQYYIQTTSIFMCSIWSKLKVIWTYSLINVVHISHMYISIWSTIWMSSLLPKRSDQINVFALLPSRK